MDNNTLIRYYEDERSDRDTVRQVWDIEERFVLPFSGEFYRDQKSEREIDWLSSRSIFDSTAVMGAQLLAASMYSNLCTGNWFDYKYKNDDANKDTEKKEWLEDCQGIVQDTINESNFSLEVPSMFLEMVTYGPGTLSQELVNESIDPNDWDGLIYKGVPTKESFFKEDTNGQVLMFFRHIQWTPLQIIDKFGEKNVPKYVRDKHKEQKGTIEKLSVIFCVYKRDNVEDKKGDKAIAPKARKWAFKYILHDTKETLGEEGGYYSAQIYIPRWRRAINSKYGYSPTTVVLPHILTANQIVKMTLAAVSKAIDPVTNVEEGAIYGDYDQSSGAVNQVTNIDGIRQQESAARIDFANVSLQDEREFIRMAYYVNHIQLKETPAMTATETIQRIKQAMGFLGPTYGRLTNDLFDPLLKDAFGLHFRMGRFKPMPESLRNSMDEYEIEYTGPMARAQKGETAQSVKMYLQGMAEMANVWPELRELVDANYVARLIATLDGVPVEVIKSEDKAKADAKARQQAEAQANQIQMAQEAGKAAEAMGKGEQAIKAVK